MVRPPTPNQIIKRHEKEKARARILTLHRQSKSYGQIKATMEAETKKSWGRSTIQQIIKRFKGRPSMTAVAQSGRPPKMTPQYVTMVIIVSISESPRYKRRLHRLALKNPKWSCAKLAQTLHSEALEVIMRHPPGSRIQVYFNGAFEVGHRCM